MEKQIQIWVLGPVRVMIEGRAVDLGGPRQVQLLAALVVDRNRSVQSDRLVDRVFDSHDLPADPRRTIRTYVARLRRALNNDDLLVTEADGYRLSTDEAACDVDLFQDLMVRAADPLLDDRRSLSLLDEALALWHGAPFEGLEDKNWLQAEVVSLEEARLAAVERRYDAMLSAGLHADAVAGLALDTQEHPLRERLIGQYMLALYRSGRQVEATRVFQSHRRRMDEELGLGPGDDLHALDRRIVANDPVLALPDVGGQALRGYRLGERIGEGSFAVVYRATQPAVGRDVAIKMIRTELANRPEFVRRFEAEAHVVARLEHPHIVPIYDYWREPDRACLVFRHLRSGTLEHRLAGKGPLSLVEAQRLVIHIGSALEAAHRVGVIHRDVRPANIFLDEEDNFYLGDFGIAFDPSEPLSIVDDQAVKDARLLPDGQLSASELGPPVDVHGLATTLRRSITGRDDWPAGLELVLARATSPDPTERHHDVRAFATEVLAVMSGSAFGEILAPPSESAVWSLNERRNPYKGLQPFTEADAGDFFGRGRQVKALLSVLAQPGQPGRTAAVVGPSGIGKSSLVRAGLLPALRQGAVANSAKWFIATMVPGNDPFGELTAALLRVATHVPDNMMSLLTDDVRGLSQVIRALVPEDSATEVCLVIDQFEELFTLVADTKIRDRFLQSLECARADERCPFRMVLTMRADFWDRLLLNGSLASSIEHSTVHLAALTPNELEIVITEPARSMGFDFEPGLIAEIVADTHDQPGALPLLQYALTQLFDRHVSGLLTRATYRDLGGVAGTVASRAEHLFLDANTHQQLGLRSVIGRLVAVGETRAEDTRRRVHRSELAEIADVDSLLQLFGDARLLAFGIDSASAEPTVEVSHEAVVHGWPRLQEWLDDDRDALRLLHRVSSAAIVWNVNGRDESELYRGQVLEAAEEAATTTVAHLTAIEQDFLTESRELHDRTAEVTRKNEERRNRLVIGLAIISVLSLIVGAVAFQQRNRATNNETAATSAAALAETRRLSADAGNVVADTPDTALLLAVEAYHRDPDAATLAGLQRVLVNTGAFLGRVGVGSTYDYVEWSSNYLVAVRQDAIDLFDPTSGQLVRTIELPGDVVAPGQEFATGIRPLDFENGKIAVALQSGDIASVDVERGVVSVVAGPVPATALSLSEDASLLLIGDSARNLRAYDLANDRELWQVVAYTENSMEDVALPEGAELNEFLLFYTQHFFDRGVLAVEWTADGNVLSSTGGYLRLFGGDDGTLLSEEVSISRSEVAGPIPLTHALLKRDGDDIVASPGSTLWRYDAKLELLDVDEIDKGRADENIITIDMVFRPGMPMVSLLQDGQISIGTLNKKDTSITRTGVTAPRGFDVSPDGGVAAVATDDGLLLWSLDGRQLAAKAVPRNDANGGMVDGSGNRLLIGGIFTAEPYRMFDVASEPPLPVALPELLASANMLAFSPRSDGILTASPIGADDGQIDLYDLESFEPAGFTTTLDFGDSYSFDQSLFVIGRGPFLTGAGPQVEVFDASDYSSVAVLDLSVWSGWSLEDFGAGLSMTAFDPSGAFLLVTLDNGNAVLFDTSSWEAVWEIEADEEGNDGIVAAAYSPDGRYLATRPQTGKIDVRDPQTLDVLFSIEGSEGNLEPLSFGPYFSPDSVHLLTTRDGQPRLWNLDERRLVGRFPNAAGFIAEGATGERLGLVTATDSSVLSWNLETASWVELACTAAGRNLTRDEWDQLGPRDQQYRATCEGWPSASDG